MGERIEWEESERWRNGRCECSPSGHVMSLCDYCNAVPSLLERALAALEAGEGMAGELIKGCEYCAGRWPKLFEIARAVDTSDGREWRHYARQPSTGYAPCALLPSQHAALADWRRCVAPRGEGA